MAEIQFKTLVLKKRFPLTISRGTFSQSTNLFVGVTENGVTGWGEMAPSEDGAADTPESGERMLRAFWDETFDPGAIHTIYAAALDQGVEPCALAALDMALWDLKAKQAGMPLYGLLGLSRSAVVTSVTVGINPPDVVRDRVPVLLNDYGGKALKVKLGSPDGIDADKDMFAALHETLHNRPDVLVRVDANGGWSLDQARHMMGWLAERGVEYIEQPLVRGAEDQLPELYKDRALPIFVDESCHIASDIPAYADCVDGTNLKLMKCGGITEALRIVATTRAFGLKTMIGCMGESSVSIAAGAALSALFDYIDLDSQLNLQPDPATGAAISEGKILPRMVPGHGGDIKDA